VLRGVSEASPEKPFSFSGQHYEIDDASIDFAPWGRPEIFFGGASPAAEQAAARQVDVYLAWGETPGQIAERLDRMRERAAQAGRELWFGIRLHVLSRDTSDHFILSGQPHLEEAYYFAEGAATVLRSRGLLAPR
jgi:alkanesulfonate monooxygenase